jgi:hypothetical protein
VKNHMLTTWLYVLYLLLQPGSSLWSKAERAFVIWRGFGMSIQGVRTCGDYMFSGHTITVTMLNFFVTECKFV